MYKVSAVRRKRGSRLNEKRVHVWQIDSVNKKGTNWSQNRIDRGTEALNAKAKQNDHNKSLFKRFMIIQPVMDCCKMAILSLFNEINDKVPQASGIRK